MIAFLLRFLFFAFFCSFPSPNHATQINALSIMKVDIERNILQRELIRYRKKNVDFVHVYFCKATDSLQYRLPTQCISGRFEHNHFGFVSDSLCRLAAASQYIASILNAFSCLSSGGNTRVLWNAVGAGSVRVPRWNRHQLVHLPPSQLKQCTSLGGPLFTVTARPKLCRVTLA